MIKKYCLILALIAGLLVKSQNGFSQERLYFKPKKQLLNTIQKNFEDAASQYKLMAIQADTNKFPKNFNPATGKFETSNSGWWCSGFYEGTLLNLYEQTHDQQLLAEANRMLTGMAKEQYNTHTHDLGFMMYNSFGNANRLSPKPEYRQILLNSARSLATRFNPKVGCIKSWEGKPTDFTVIIDNMMNLELLFWATRETGDSSFYKIAVTHANTTMKNHYRADYSSYHVINYNPQTGEVQQKKTAQGYANESAWARGQVWGLYGFTVMYRETGDKKYLEQAQHIAHFLLTNPNLPADKIPYWDFNDPGIPNVLRDASAGAIMASALLELGKYSTLNDGIEYFKTAETILETLSSPTYKSEPGTNGGFLLKHSVGHFPQKTEVDVSISYADYYFVEAMKRYKQLAAKKVMLDYYFNHEVRKNKTGKMERFHYMWTDKSDGGFLLFGNAFTFAGAVLDTLDNAPTRSNLARTSVYIIVDPDTKKESPNPNYIGLKDINEIEAWVKAGGVLVMMANDSANVELPHFNNLAARFGMHFNNDLQNHVIDDKHFDDGAITTTGNPIFKTAQKIYIKDASSIGLTPPAKAALKNSNGAVIIATAKYGKGTVFAVGDPWLYNEYTNGRLPTGFENDKAANDLVEWLLQQVAQ